MQDWANKKDNSSICELHIQPPTTYQYSVYCEKISILRLVKIWHILGHFNDFDLLISSDNYFYRILYFIKFVTLAYIIREFLSMMYEHRDIQGGSNMTGTDLFVNKPHCAAAVRPWESEATTSTLSPARVRTCSVLSGSC